MQTRGGMGEVRQSLRVRVALAVGLAALLVLHFDFWRPGGWPGSVGGLPGELVYRLAWMALAYAYLAWFLRVVWREREGREER